MLVEYFTFIQNQVVKLSLTSSRKVLEHQISNFKILAATKYFRNFHRIMQILMRTKIIVARKAVQIFCSIMRRNIDVYLQNAHDYMT